jgi:hypothetical protein
MATVRFVSLAGEENVAPPFRTPVRTVTDALFAHVEAHTRRAVCLCDGEEVLERGATLPEDGVVSVTPTPHRTLAHAEALSDNDCIVSELINRMGFGFVLVDRHGRPLTWVVRNTRVMHVDHGAVSCLLTKLQQEQRDTLFHKLLVVVGEDNIVELAQLGRGNYDREQECVTLLMKSAADSTTIADGDVVDLVFDVSLLCFQLVISAVNFRKV